MLLSLRGSVRGVVEEGRCRLHCGVVLIGIVRNYAIKYYELSLN
jgi:hypothetical protein